MSWFRYLCEGRRTSGAICDGSILVCAVNDVSADDKAREDHGWKPVVKAPCKCDCHDRHGQDEHCGSCSAVHELTGPTGWLCNLKHREEVS